MRNTAALILILAVLILGVGASPGAKPPALKPVPIPSTEAPGWEGAQIVQADHAGRVWFLRPDTFEAYPLVKDAFGEPVRLQATEEPAGFILDATMSRGGDRWLLLMPRNIRLFIDGKEKPLPPLDWRPSSIAFLRDTAVVGVLPHPMRRIVDPEKLGTPPWLVQFDGNRWNPLVVHRGLSGKEAWKTDMNEQMASHAVFMAGDRDGKLWVAHRYAYRVQRFSAAGRPLLEIVLGDGKVRHRKEEEPLSPEVSQALERAKAQGKPATFQAFTAQPVIRGIAVGRDGRLYLVVHGSEDEGMALDRYDPVRSVVERAPLELKIPDGLITLAAGKDGLYLAAHLAKDGRWRLPWEAIEEAAWKAIDEATIDGVPVAAER